MEQSKMTVFSKIDFFSSTPVFCQIAEIIENAILSGIFEEESQIPSTTDISKYCKISPSTVLKGIGILVNKGLLYKRTGVGIFVCKDACNNLSLERKKDFYENYIRKAITEAKRLGISVDDIRAMIK